MTRKQSRSIVLILKTIMIMIFIKNGLKTTLLVLVLAQALQARMITREEALSAAFPGAQIAQSMIFLTDAEVKEASRLSGAAIQSALVARYTATTNGKNAGSAYLDTHVVRTKKESLLLIVDAQGKLLRVEVVAFLEPPDYLPQDRWYRQFDGRLLNDDLALNRGIHPVTGATLTARATTDAARRALAIDQVLRKRGAKQP